MTGKEALEKLLNTLKHWQGRNTIFDKIQGDCILKELEELAKYKRAFEILKDYSVIPPLEDFRYSEYTNCYFAEIEEYDHDYEDYRTIHYVLEKDEYELLEELMKDAKD